MSSHDLDPYCEDAVAVLIHWQDTNGAPYWVTCRECEWDGDGPDPQHSHGPDGLPCSTCGGTGWKSCSTLEDCGWAVDEFTVHCARIHRLWRNPDEE